jgi:hypothetical protein
MNLAVFKKAILKEGRDCVWELFNYLEDRRSFLKNLG